VSETAAGPQGREQGPRQQVQPRRDAAPADVDLSRAWNGVAAVLWRREPGWLERAAGRLLRSPGLARALVTTPSLLVPWLLASIVVLAAGAVTTLGTGEPLVGLLAPAVAAAGIAYAYGPGIDPAWELSCSMPVSDRMVLLVRALAVFAVDAVLGLAASAASGAAAGITFGWLIPMTAVSALALAAATLTRSANAGVAAGLSGWVITVLASRAPDGNFTSVLAGRAMLLPCLAFAACCIAITLHTTRASRGAG
jgi:hypothetical protein